MKLRSFRLRIALLSTLLAGSALIGFGVASWLLIYDAKLNRLDGEIEKLLLRESAPPRPVSHWHPYASSLSSVLGVASQSAIALLVMYPDGRTVYKSDRWSSELSQVIRFPGPTTPVNLFPPPPVPPHERRPPPVGEGQGFPPLRQNGKGESDALPEVPLGPPPGLPMPPDEPQVQLSKVVTQHASTGSWRIGVVTSPFVRLAIAVNLQAIDQEMSAIRNVFLIAVPLVLLLVAIGAWALSGSALTPLQEVTATIRRVTAKGLDQRIPIATADIEFLELLQVFNQMMERLERSFKQASRFSADAAHELKTPLAILQGELERTLQQVDAGSQVQERLSSLLDEVRRLGAIVRKLLLLSLADAGQMRLHRVEVDLCEVLADLVEDIDLLAPDLEIQTQIPPALQVWADRDLLIQVLQNLISNAVKYNLPNGWIGIEAGRQQGTVSVTISNSSKGIPESECDRIFERFHRGDAAHTRQIEGLGLGLSLSREIARAHGGELTLDQASGAHTTFILTLPIHR